MNISPYVTVVMAVYNAKTPIISAIGHETDFSLIDFVADCRAGTPSIASEIAFYDEFEELRNKFGWGVNIPYMISGSYSLPQKDIMEWMSRRRYSVTSIVQTLQNRTLGNKAFQFEPLETSPEKCCLIIGGGNSVAVHLEAIQSFILKNKEFV